MTKYGNHSLISPMSNPNLRIVSSNPDFRNVPADMQPPAMTNATSTSVTASGYFTWPAGPDRLGSHLFQLFASPSDYERLNQPVPTGDAMATESELTDAEIAAAEARTDAKIARMEGSISTALATITGKIDALSGQVSDQRRDRNLIIGTIVVAAIALGGMLWGMATYGDALFGRGMNVRDVVSAVIKEQQSHTPPQTPSKN